MKKKHYELIARIFNKNIHDKDPKMAEVRYSGNTIAKAMAQQFADVLSKDNPKFDRAKFLEACGVTE